QWMLAPAVAREAVDAWRTRPRLSLVEVVEQVNHARVVAQREHLQRLWVIHRPAEELVNHPHLPAAQLAEQAQSQAELAEMMRNLATGAREYLDLKIRARLLRLA